MIQDSRHPSAQDDVDVTWHTIYYSWQFKDSKPIPVNSQILSIAVLTAFLDPSNAMERSSTGLVPDSRILLISESPDPRSEHTDSFFIIKTTNK